ncbi:hypothetical protein M0805_006136 [Coniferiporia weirii]|nr:hypothetical protein M0805_006136 [Coniferiporia weirii]
MVLHLARKLAATVLGHDPADPKALRELEEAGVPVTDADCRACADPCDQGHEDFARRFDVDLETEMRGSVKPYRRQVLISTGKADWAREVTDVAHSLAKHLSDADGKLSRAKPADSPPPPDKRDSAPGGKAKVAGVFAAPPAGRLSILNGSHTSSGEDDDDSATALVLPDYVAVSGVPVGTDGAEALWRHALDPAVLRAGTALTPPSTTPNMKTWTLPYSCLIMLCSHKKRDARCHIAAQRLETDFMHVLQAEGWAVDTDLEDLTSTGLPLEDLASSAAERSAAALAQLQAIGTGADQKKALILKTSHIGGHKFAGNVIIYFPQGLSVWYGRVTPHEVDAIVKHTILDGKVLAPLLRGGLNISRPGCSSLLEW